MVIYDAPSAATRRIIETALQEAGFVRLFANARYSGARTGEGATRGLRRALRARLGGHAYRMLFLELRGRARVEARWMAAVAKESRL